MAAVIETINRRGQTVESFCVNDGETRVLTLKREPFWVRRQAVVTDDGKTSIERRWDLSIFHGNWVPAGRKPVSCPAYLSAGRGQHYRITHV